MEGGRSGEGGGIFSALGSSTVLNATIIANQLGAPGRNLTMLNFNVDGFGAAIGKQSGSMSLGASIVEGDCGSNPPTDAGGNVVAPTPAFRPGGGTKNGGGDLSCPGLKADPLLQPLASNGGSVQTLRLGTGSVAINHIPGRPVRRPTRAA